jgi:hypothetical protein
MNINLNSLCQFLLFLSLLIVVQPKVARSESEIECIKLSTQSSEKPTCGFSKTLVPLCVNLPSTSVFSQCNIYSLSIGSVGTKYDDNNRQYLSVVYKYSERNNCVTGENSTIAFFGKCDIFSAYVQFLRDLHTNKCYALVNSALLGIQLQEDSKRNNPNKVVKKLEIPGVARRITFTPANQAPLLGQSSSILLRTADEQRPYIRSGSAVSALSLLELESPLTVKQENLKSHPAKIRLTRGIGTHTDFLDIPLGRTEESALNEILSGCS